MQIVHAKKQHCDLRSARVSYMFRNCVQEKTKLHVLYMAKSLIQLVPAAALKICWKGDVGN